jgi:hypothetical protein
MAALDYLHRAGLTVEAVAGKLRVSPVEWITPEHRQYIVAHKVELLVELAAANEITAAPATWLHLLVLADGRVIQRCGERSTANVEAEARLHYGDDLLAVVAVPGFERPLTEAEIEKAQAGTFAAPAVPPPSSSTWLARVARPLVCSPAYLLERGYLDQHDIEELQHLPPRTVANLIRSGPHWRPAERPVSAACVATPATLATIRHVATAATASPAWIAARDAFHNHLWSCHDCHAPTDRYCATGADRRATYDRAALESAP